MKLLEAGQTSTVTVKAGELVEKCVSLTDAKPCEFMLPKGYAKVWVEGDVTVPDATEVYLANTYDQVAEVTESSVLVPAIVSGSLAAVGLGMLGGAFYNCNSPLTGIDRELNGDNATACFGIGVTGLAVAGSGVLMLGVSVLSGLLLDTGAVEVKTVGAGQAHAEPESVRAAPQLAIDYSPNGGKKSVLATWHF